MKVSAGALEQGILAENFEVANQRLKFKVFFGSTLHPVDEVANKWLEENPDILLYSYKYCRKDRWDSSICILYEETVKEG